MQGAVAFSISTFVFLSFSGCGGGSAPTPVPRPPATSWSSQSTPIPVSQVRPIPANIPTFSSQLTPQQFEDGSVVATEGIFDEQFNELRKLIRMGKEDELIEALEKEPLFNTYKHGQIGNLLLHACGLGKMKCSKYMLEHGADVNVVTAHGGTALETCIFLAGNVKAPVDVTDPLDFLLANGADPKLVGVRRGKWKTERDVIVASDTYLEYGVKLQRSKVHHVVQRNAVLARLREHLELPVDAMLPINAPALYLAGSRPQQIEDGRLVRATGILDDQFDELVRLMQHGKEDEFIEALEKKPLFNRYQHSRDGNLLYQACAMGKMKCSKYLIEHGADPNVLALHGTTALEMCILLAGNVKPPIKVTDPLDILLASGANPTLVGVRTLEWKIERDVIVASDTYLEFGVKLQRSKGHHRIQRNAVLARLREHLELPVDAMLPINAPALYLAGSK